ncbi:MAG: Uma2 family endonuclease [Isosphaeraceae bacterium]|nr:Uma2 family endonuclease [Isosphaeraceae bacterium]
MATAELRTVDPHTATSAPGTLPPDAPGSGFPAHRLTIARYERMVDQGIFGEDEPIFLWHGRLVGKMTTGPRHHSSSNKLLKRMDRLMPEGWRTEHETPLALRDDTMPEPDIKVVRGVPEDDEERVASVRDVALVVEVADSSLAVDSGEVWETYAREGIPVYWIVNLPGRRIDVYSQPSGPANPPRYAEHQSYGPGDEVPLVIDGHTVGRIAVDNVLPRRN